MEAAGLRAVSDIDEDDPQVSQLTTIIDREKRNSQVDGYPFNTDKVDLVVNIDGVIDVAGFLDVELPNGLQILDGKVWDPRESAFHDETITDVWVISDREWTDIPTLFQEWIARKAARAFISAIKGPDDTYLEARNREVEAFSAAHNSSAARWDPVLKQERDRRRNWGGGTMDNPGYWAYPGQGWVR